MTCYVVYFMAIMLLKEIEFNFKTPQNTKQKCNRGFIPGKDYIYGKKNQNSQYRL